MFTEPMPWILGIAGLAIAGLAIYFAGKKKAIADERKKDVKEIRKQAQELADTPGTDDDFHKRMRDRIDRKD